MSVSKPARLTIAQWKRAHAIAKSIVNNPERQPIPLSTEETQLLAQCIVNSTFQESPRVGNDDAVDGAHFEHRALEVEGDALVGVVTSEDEAHAFAAQHGLPYLAYVKRVADRDVEHILVTDVRYGGSWQRRGGIGAFMMLARKWDRLEERVRKHGYDVFVAIMEDTHREGVIDDVRDLRRYLALVEAKAIIDSNGRIHV